MPVIFVKRTPRGNRIGEDHPCAKLTEEMVLHIRALRAQGHGYKKIARLTGVKWGTVRSVLTYRTWRHVRDADAKTDGPRGAVAP